MARSATVIIAIVIAAAVGIGYSAFLYAQEPSKKPIAVDTKPTTTTIRIVEGASLESNPEFMVPQVATVVIGVNNTVRWISEDDVPHTIVSDSEYKDPVTSKVFDTRERSDEGGAFLMPGESYEFTFTQPGRYDYHHEPHPWVTGTIIVKEQQSS